MFNFNFKEVGADSALLKIHGRTLFDNGLLLSWSNSGVELSFVGTRVEFNFGEFNDVRSVYVKAFTQKSETRFGLSGSEPRVILDFKSDKAHSVKLLRISEGDVPLILQNIKIFGKAPELLPPPPEKKLKLEFLGDSITAGYGVLASGEQKTYYTYEQDSTKTYAYMCAEMLDAEIRTEAYSGQGVFRNCAGADEYQFKRIFDMCVRVRDGYDHSQWTPDVMVLNCGTNDVPGGTDDETMYREAELLIDKIRLAYPEAKIIWTYGLMNDKFHPTFKKLISDKNESGDKNIYYLPLDAISREKNEVGAVGHPNANASLRASKTLATFIKKIL